MTDNTEDVGSDRKGLEEHKRRPVPGYQASPEEQTWFARTFSSDVVIMPVAPRQKPSTIPKKQDGAEVLPTTKRNEGV